MSKTESTAVTAFINSVRQDMDGGYLRPSLGTNAPPIRPTRPLPAPNPTQPAGTPAPTWASPPPATPARARGTLPPPTPSAGRPSTERPSVRAPSQLIIPPHLQDAGETTPTPRVDISPSDDHWFESAETHEDEEVSALQAIAIDWEEFGDVEITDDDLKLDAPKKRGWLLPVAGIGLLGAGAAVAAFIALSGGSGDKLDAKVASAGGDRQTQASAASATPANAATAATAPAAAAPAAAAEPMPAAPPIAEPAADDEPAAAPTPATPGGIVLRPANFTSDPPGATVTLVMNGKPVTLGPSPVDAQLDPSKSYEVVFTMPGKPTVLRQVSFDGTGEIAIGVSMTGDEPVAAAIPAEDEATEDEPAAEEPEAAAEPEPVKKITKRKKARTRSRKARRSPRKRPSKKVAANTMRGNQGILMINAKPPCDLYVDGRRVGKTPQLALKLSAGKHSIKLVNGKYGIKKSFGVRITKGKKTKVIKDLSDRM